MVGFLEIVHAGVTVSLSKFAEDNGVFLGEIDGSAFTLQQFFEYEGNSSRIQSALRPNEESSNSTNAIVRPGVIIRVPKERLDKEIIATGGNQVVPNENFDAYIDSRIKEIIGDTDYKPLNLEGVDTSKGKTFRFLNQCSVWIWSKTLGGATGTGKLINITPFVQSINTNVGKNGGNFVINLSQMVGEILPVAGGKWQLRKGTAEQFAYRDTLNIVSRTSASTFQKGVSGTEEFIQKLFLFHNIIQSNDIVFIKFETLQSERLKRDQEIGSLTLDSLELDPVNLISGQGSGKKQLFDMIGLADSNSQSVTPEGVSIQVAGRDLMKLLIEDGCYFFPTDIAGVTAGIQGEKKSRAIQRIVTGDLNFFNAYVDRTIDFSLRFIFNMLTNIQVCDESLFRNYGGDRTTRFEYAKDIDETASELDLRETPVEGIWQIIKLVIDPIISGRRLVDTSIVGDQGNILSFVNGKVIQDPFVEFYGDTYGNQYFFMSRKPPHNKEAYISNSKYAIDIREEDVISENLQWDDAEVYSWYRIIPRGNFFGDDEALALTYFPAVFFEEYAKIWGSRPYQVVSNYIDYDGVISKGSRIELDHLVEQAYQDLAFVIQSSAYLPFSRKGTITIKGDRRIKTGNMIRHKGTGELYLVEGVSQSFQIGEEFSERITTLSVVRGLKERFVKGSLVFVPAYSDGSGSGMYRNVSYFDIIKMSPNDQGIAGTKNFTVDKDIFNFFIRRMQVDISQNNALNENLK